MGKSVLQRQNEFKQRMKEKNMRALNEVYVPEHLRLEVKALIKSYISARTREIETGKLC
jgi:hypothetical protein